MVVDVGLPIGFSAGIGFGISLTNLASLHPASKTAPEIVIANARKIIARSDFCIVQTSMPDQILAPIERTNPSELIRTDRDHYETMIALMSLYNHAVVLKR